MWLGKTFVWAYDEASNITICKECAYINKWEEIFGSLSSDRTRIYVCQHRRNLTISASGPLLSIQ